MIVAIMQKYKPFTGSLFLPLPFAKGSKKGNISSLAIACKTLGAPTKRPNALESTLELQRQLLKDYEEDITKYAKQTDKAKLLAVYNHISTFLAKDNKKYQITKVAKGARNREYVGAVDWLKEAGVINVCYCLNNVELPLIPPRCLRRQIRQRLKLSKYLQLKILQEFTGIFTNPFGEGHQGDVMFGVRMTWQRADRMKTTITGN